jgi:hypothetical protein
MVNEEIRKGPWTEQEDVQLVFYVKLFGDRRWDFIAKVSGLKVWRENKNNPVGAFLISPWDFFPPCMKSTVNYMDMLYRFEKNWKELPVALG